MQDWTRELKRMGACPEALEWVDAQLSWAGAWANCQQGDWMLWLAGKLSGPPESEGRKKLVLAACACARLALPYVKAGELRPLRAIETAEAWTRGDATIKQVRGAAYTAYTAAAAAYTAAAAAYTAAAAAYTAAAAAAAYTAYTAAAYTAYTAAAYTAYAAAYAAYAAASDAAAAAYAAAAAAYAARTKLLAQCADIVRRYYPDAPALKGKEG